MPGQLQVGQQLGLMHRQQVIRRFDFNHKTVVNHHVEPQAGIEPQPVVDHRQRNLPTNMPASLLQFMRQAQLVHALEQPGAQCGVNREGGTENLSSRLIRCLRNLFPLCLCVLVVHS